MIKSSGDPAGYLGEASADVVGHLVDADDHGEHEGVVLSGCDFDTI